MTPVKSSCPIHNNCCTPTHQLYGNMFVVVEILAWITYISISTMSLSKASNNQIEKTTVYQYDKLCCEQEIRSVEVGVCPMHLFHFLITWRSSSSKCAAVYKISSKLDNFSLRYRDITIFKMGAVRHLVIVLQPYETTHEVSVAGRSCLSNFMSMWYTDLKI